MGVASDDDEEVGVTDTVVGDVLCGELEAARDVPFEPEREDNVQHVLN